MHQLNLDLFLSPLPQTNHNLILGNCNFLPFQWLDRWPAWPTAVMALYGPPKSGKSYLGNLWQQKSQAHLYTIEQFEKKTWGEHLFTIDVPHFCIRGIPQQEQNFLHFFNEIQQRKGFLLLIDHLPPAYWNIQLPDLKSRLNALPALGIDQPDEEFLKTLLLKLFSDHQLKIPSEMIDFILCRLPRSFQAIHSFVKHLCNTDTSFTTVKNIITEINHSVDLQ